jgi:hypothetical protein
MTTLDSSAIGMISSRNFWRFSQSCGRLAAGSRSAEKAGRPGIRACPGHEVVAEDRDLQIAEMADERLHRREVRAVIGPELDPLDREVALDGRDGHPERPNAPFQTAELLLIRPGIAQHDLLDAALGRQRQVLVG